MLKGSEFDGVRERLGMTKGAFAEGLGITRQYLWMITEGHREPSATLRLLLARLAQDATAAEAPKEKCGSEGKQC